MNTDWLNKCHTGECLTLLKQLPADIKIDAIITDPPYGIAKLNKFGTRHNLAKAMEYTPVANDDVPFDPTPWLNYPIVALFGANWYADKLPPSGGWLVWDKKDGGSSDNFADGEMCWTNARNTMRIFSHKWRGFIRASENKVPRVHPTQKPIAVMEWVLDMCGVKQGMTVLDPYAGSGTTGVACINKGVNFIGFELVDKYTAIANKRITEAIVEKEQL